MTGAEFKKYIIISLFLFQPISAFAQCDTVVDGNCRLDVDIIEYKGLASEPSVSASGSARAYFDSVSGTLLCSVDGGSYSSCGLSGGITALVDDETPEAGGNLDMLFLDINNGGTITANTIVTGDEAYGAGWNSSAEVPTKNALYDKIETLSASGGGTQDDGTMVRLSSTTDDFCVGGTTPSTCGIFVDESAETIYADEGFKVGDNTDKDITLIALDLSTLDHSFTWNNSNSRFQLSAPLFINSTSPSVLSLGLTVNDGADNTADGDFIVKGGSVTVIDSDAATDTVTTDGTWIFGNLGIEFTESDTNPTCASGDYSIYADLSETTLKKCINGTASDLDTGGGSSEWTDTGSIVHPSESTVDEVAIGGTTEAGADIFLGVDGTAVFNEQGNSVDFRVEGNTETSLLFVDGSADGVGVGTASIQPNFDLTVGAGGMVSVGSVHVGTSGPGCVMIRNTEDTAWYEIGVTSGSIYTTLDADGICDGS